MIITFLCALPHVDYMLSLIHAAPNHPSPLAYSVLILLVTSCFPLLFLLSLLCHHHYFRCHHHFHITVATNTSFPSKYLSGAVELTTQLLKLINILWLPLCRINKLGYSYPRRLLRSPTLVGHHSFIVRRCSGSPLLRRYWLAFISLFASDFFNFSFFLSPHVYIFYTPIKYTIHIFYNICFNTVEEDDSRAHP